MKVSTKGRYALRLMLDLAVNNTGEPISLKDIARRQGISDKYLEQIISVLNKAKYVKSIRGAQGGYILTKKPEEYTIGMILRLTEGSLAPVACVEEENTCEKIHDCATILVWQKMNEAINDVVDHMTLQDLVDYEMKECAGLKLTLVVFIGLGDMLSYLAAQDRLRGCVKNLCHTFLLYP